jgi:hypothetical protein
MKRKLSIVYSLNSNPRINYISKLRLNYLPSNFVDDIIKKCESIISKYYYNQDFTIHFIVELQSGIDFITYKNWSYTVRQAKIQSSKSYKDLNYSDKLRYKRDMF